MKKTKTSNKIISIILLVALLAIIPADGVASLVEVEEHDLDIAMADGIFDGNSSDFDMSVTADVGTKEGKRIFNILEILPSERMGTIAYTIAGFEPVADALETQIEVTVKGKKVKKDISISAADMRKACMDALFNRVPGLRRNEGGANPQPDQKANTLNSPDTPLNLITQINYSMQESGGEYPFDVPTGKTYSGYYKYVGSGNGYYAKSTSGKGDNVMVSKFHKNENSNTGKFDYIWIEGNAGYEAENGDIMAPDQPRLKYKNIDKFFIDMYPVDDIEEFKSTHKIEITTRTPKTTDLAAVERADLIIINNAGTQMRYYPDALGIYNIIHNEDDIATERGNTFFEGNDFPSFEIAKKIYERVVIRQDVAIITEKNTSKLYKIQKKNNGEYVTQNTNWQDAGVHYQMYVKDREEIETNMAKLMRMLYFVNKNVPGKDPQFRGREMFMDFMKCYVDEPGEEYMKLRRENPDGKYLAPGLHGKSGNYMHYYVEGQHPGHPLVPVKSMAILSSEYDPATGKFEPKYAGEDDYVEGFVARRPDKMDKDPLFRKYFDWANIPYVEETDPWGDGWDYRADMYQSRSNTTDYIYIDKNGTLIRDDKYSSIIVGDNNSYRYTGYWYEMDDDMNISRKMAKPIAWKYEENKEWPWDVNADGVLPYWFFSNTTTGVKLWQKTYGVGNLHLMFDYVSWGSYWAVQTPEQGRLDNQTLVQENELYKNNWIQYTLRDRKVKREIEGTDHFDEVVTEKHYFSANIQNGDGGNKYKMTNKVLYYNDYETITDKNNKAYIPLKIKVRTTIPIQKIELYNTNTVTESGGYTPFATYIPRNSNALGANDIECNITRKFTPPASSVMTLKNETVMVEGKPQEVTVGEDEKYYPYVYEAQLDDMLYNNDTYKRGSVNTIVLRMTVDKTDTDGNPLYVEDRINIVKRTFFTLM